MKPYGRHNTVKGGNTWKVDHHIHPKRKYRNWWEAMIAPLSRARMKQITAKEVEKEIVHEKAD